MVVWDERVSDEGRSEWLCAKENLRSTARSNGMNPSAMPAEETLAMVTRRQRHPQLPAQMAAILDEVANRAGAINTGDEAEDVIVERKR
jgi:hypothetical protein